MVRRRTAPSSTHAAAEAEAVVDSCGWQARGFPAGGAVGGEGLEGGDLLPASSPSPFCLASPPTGGGRDELTGGRVDAPAAARTRMFFRSALFFLFSQLPSPACGPRPLPATTLFDPPFHAPSVARALALGAQAAAPARTAQGNGRLPSSAAGSCNRVPTARLRAPDRLFRAGCGPPPARRALTARYPASSRITGGTLLSGSVSGLHD